ncbi:MAG: excinuclease ABC subunit UvrB [Candidatus Eremiobacteraeota bacterium]|nr:excinuclease ABC subunit UvrB [Candidatus Eremiobacteraeota bacterium]MCW5867484.1 excinuclease ABC subunit UvrB [Candidatus Eremiobacteraeota bacterium]
MKLVSPFPPSGDQPQAIEQIVASLEAGNRFTTLLGATGTGKTFTMASVIARMQRPVLVMSPNKTLCAQLCSEFRDFFPESAVEYFVSYYDYYQPEAYVASSDTYIEKDASINDDIDRLRHSATQAVLERRDALVVASVSCIYGLGSPEDYQSGMIVFRPGEEMPRQELLRRLVDLQYQRTQASLTRSSFRMQGDVLEIHPVDQEVIVRIEFFGDEVERMSTYDPLTGEFRSSPKRVVIYPASHYVTPYDKRKRAVESIEEELRDRLAYFKEHDRLLEAQRLEMRTRYDLEMLQEIGYCNGVENYSRHLTGRRPGETPYTLMSYFPRDYIVFMDESHASLPQVRAMLHGDRARKDALVEHGFRLPSAYDNRPLAFDEFLEAVGQVVFVSATPGEYERQNSQVIVEQIIRPTGLLDPEIEQRPVAGQIDDLLAEIRLREQRQERVLVTTLTKKMSEDLTDYLTGLGVRVRYLHSEVDTLGRIQILRDLRLGDYDVLVGINLLREGLDLPEVSLVAILDADQEGFLRSSTSLIQTIGRAARNVSGKVILYADRQTKAIQEAVGETNRRREIQRAYNQQHGIEPETVRKAVSDILDTLGDMGGSVTANERSARSQQMNIEELQRSVLQLRAAMQQAARNLEFETAAALRDEIFDMEKTLKEKTGDFAVGLALEGTTDIPARRGARPARQGPARPGEPGYKTPRARKSR